MQNESLQRIEALFHAASKHPAGAERQAYLDGACAEDADARLRVEALLKAHDESMGFLDDPAVASTREGPGSTIGPYKLLQEIGEGGMGVVYMAEQERPVRRKVALKIIKLGMDTKQVIARFEAERQALAMMEHANIARVFDAGSTETGRPYFVMELVRGVPINEYCDTHKLSTQERLELFVEVCRAVQHAHQKGIIHRDLKPSNVMITSHDGTPVPKIIDFGVSKATNQKLTERTLFTEFHQIIGTLEYMSPEQAEMSGLDVDTRSDIYSLGVLLYQLLTGTTPADPADLRTAAFSEMTRMIREDEPQVPSTRISKLGEDGEKIARHRSSDTRSLSKHCRGDLDWIVMKALEKDRTRRYDTASAFAADITRHLEDRPVDAGPPGAWYRIGKFVHRNQKAVAASMVLLGVIGLGLAGTSAGFLRASAEAERSGRVSETLQDVLAMTDAARAADLGEVQKVLGDVRELFGEDHATYAAVLDTLALRLHDAGDFSAATELFRESLEIWKGTYGAEHQSVAITLSRLGTTLRAQGSDDQAETALRSSLAILDAASVTPSLAGFDARVELADLLGNRGEYVEADALLGEALAILRASPAPAHFRIIETLERRTLLQLSMPAADARQTLREVYDEAHEFYPEGNPLLAISALGYGKQLYQHDEKEQAEPYLREAIRRFEASTQAPSVYLLGARDTLFQIVRGRDDQESILETDDLLRDMIAVAREIWGTDALATNLKYYAGRLKERGRYGDALEAMLDGHQVLIDAGRSVSEREDLRDNLTMLAFVTAFQPDREREVYILAREAAERTQLEEPEHPAMLVTLGVTLYRLGEFARAAETLDLAKPLSSIRGGLARNMAPADHAFRAMAHARLGHDEVARAELALLRAGIAASGASEESPAILREAQALIETTSPSTEGD